MSLSLRTYLLAAAITLLGILGQWWGGSLYNLWRFPAGMLILAILLEGLLLRRQGISLERQINSTLTLGQTVGGHITVTNRKSYPLYLETQTHYPPSLLGQEALIRWRVPASANTEQPFILTPMELGNTSLGPLYLRILGRLGLVWWSRKPLPGQPLKVIPSHLSHTEIGTGTIAGGHKAFYSISGSGTELLSLRDYQTGDPLHAIDWKATARSQKPTVRVYSQEQHMDLVLVLDAGRGSRLQVGALSRLHHYVNVAARLTELAIRQGDRVGLVVFADKLLRSVAMGKGMPCLQAIRTQLEAVHSQPRESNPLAAVLFLRRLLRHRGLVVFLTEIEEREAATQLLQATQLLVPKHSPLIASLVDEQVEALQHRAARRWLDPYLSYAALEYAQSVHNTVMHLQRLGAQVVLAKPEQLDSMVLGHYRRLRERRRV